MYQAVIDSINEMSLQGDDQEQQAELLSAYETSISGFAAKLSTKHLQSLEKVDGFLSATPDQLLQLHTTIDFPSSFLAYKLGRTRNYERSISQNEEDDIDDDGFVDTTNDDDDEYEEVEEEESLPRVSDSGQGSAGDKEKQRRVERGFQIVQGC
ncbi:hypothetical protein LWI29_026040 [Acer saccharum]|uniref:Inhibitor I9 domain-containing protein n=1 Tax=Acer saccharum TaxID=4024 RepID=A0AA39VJ38_ACESA|nr:hypothetical protein LWI29_026040 [Acer saccharum]